MLAVGSLKHQALFDQLVQVGGDHVLLIVSCIDFRTKVICYDEENIFGLAGLRLWHHTFATNDDYQEGKDECSHSFSVNHNHSVRYTFTILFMTTKKV